MENSVGGGTASGADVGMAVAFETAFSALPSHAYALAGGFDNKHSVGAFGEGVMFAIPGFFCQAFDDRHGVGVDAATDGAWGEWVVGVEIVLVKQPNKPVSRALGNPTRGKVTSQSDCRW